MDWSINDNFMVSFVAAVAEPGKAIEESSGRTDTFCVRNDLRRLQLLTAELP